MGMLREYQIVYKDGTGHTATLLHPTKVKAILVVKISITKVSFTLSVTFVNAVRLVQKHRNGRWAQVSRRLLG
jgi:NRPS condensation-like uncharacterized protein